MVLCSTRFVAQHVEPTSPGIQVEIWMSNQDKICASIAWQTLAIQFWTIAIHRPWNMFKKHLFLLLPNSREMLNQIFQLGSRWFLPFPTGGSNALLWTDLDSSQGLEHAKQHESLMLFNLGLSQNIPQIHSFLQKEISLYCAEELAYHSISVSIVEPKQGGVQKQWTYEHSSYTFQLQARPSSTLQGMLAWTPQKICFGHDPRFSKPPRGLISDSKSSISQCGHMILTAIYARCW